MAQALISAPARRNPTRQPRRMTLETYFRAEEKAPHKHEFHNGIIIAMAGAKLQHNLLAQKAASLIDSFVEENSFNYKVSNSDTKIRIEQFNKVVYPDAVVICEQPDYYQNRRDVITNPLIVVEVLSQSTEKHDRDSKFEWYRSLPSFQEYVLVNQDYKRVSVYTRQADNSWLLLDYDGDDAVAVLYALHNCPLPLKRLYRGLDL
jgi:Uma2 family endonuclease